MKCKYCQLMVDTNSRIAYPLTQVRVRGVSNEEKNTEDIRRYDS